MAAGSKPASITLTLNRGPFKDGIKDAEKDVVGFSERANKALKGAFSDGVKGAGAAVKDLLGSIKNGLAAVSGIGGMMGTAELIRSAMATQSVYKGVAFSIRAGTGDASSFRDVMASGGDAAQKWGKNVDQLGGAMKEVWTKTGDVNFTKKSIDTIAMVSRASHESTDALGSLAGSLHKSFKITEDQLGDTLGLLLQTANKGGVGFDELSASVQRMGGFAKQAGMQSEGGLKKMIGLLGAGASGAEGMGRNIGGATSLIEQLSQATPARSMLLMRAGMTGENGTLDPWSAKLKGKDPTELIKLMVQGMGGRKERMGMTFEGDQLAFLSDLGAVYKKAFDETKGGQRAKMDAGMKALDDSMKKAAESALSGADMQQMATDAMKDGPAKMEAAMEKMKAAFQRPEIAEAVGKLADLLPKLAEVVSAVVGFASAHPIGAGAALIGGTAAKGFGEAAVGSLISAAFARGGASAAGAVGTGIATAGTEAGTKAGAGLLAAAAPWALAAGAAFAAGMALSAAKNTYSDLDKKSGGHGMEYWLENAKHNVGLTSDEEYWKSRSGLTGEEAPAESAFAYQEALKRKEAAQKGEPAGGAADAFEEAMRRKESLGGFDDALGRKDMALAGPRIDMLDKQRAPQRSADDSRLLAEMLAAKELRVKVTNAAELRDPSAGPGTPRPGYIPRE